VKSERRTASQRQRNAERNWTLGCETTQGTTQLQYSVKNITCAHNHSCHSLTVHLPNSDACVHVHVQCFHEHISTPKGSGWCEFIYHFSTRCEDKRVETYYDTIQDLYDGLCSISSRAPVAYLLLLAVERA
jgi:hypothetical protein